MSGGPVDEGGRLGVLPCDVAMTADFAGKTVAVVTGELVVTAEDVSLLSGKDDDDDSRWLTNDCTASSTMSSMEFPTFIKRTLATAHNHNPQR